MSKASILLTMQQMKDKFISQRVKLDTEIANLKTESDAKKVEKQALTDKIQQLTLDMAEVQNSTIP